MLEREERENAAGYIAAALKIHNKFKLSNSQAKITICITLWFPPLQHTFYQCLCLQWVLRTWAVHTPIPIYFNR